MNGQGISQIVFYSVALVALGYPLGLYMARIYSAERIGSLFGSVERGFYGLVRADARKEQDWKAYGTTVLVFSVLFFGLLYVIQRARYLFLNPDHEGGASAPRAEHGCELHHEHELAVLRRR
jgi:K+-transporting ATPase ATPase A chain